jgi:hypothetical protein
MRTIDYNDVVGVSEEEFRASTDCFTERVYDTRAYTRSSEEDIARVERLLDVREGTLQESGDFYIGRYECECGSLLTTYDFVFTALVDAGHSKSLILHTFLGNKFVLNPPRRMRCSQCGRLSERAETY